MTDARTVKRGRIPTGLSNEKAARMLAALREGRTLRKFSITGNSPRFLAYCEAHPEYSREALPLIEANAKAAQFRKGSVLRGRTHCKFGHPLSGDNLFLHSKGWRCCRICDAKSHELNRRMSDQQARRVVDALNAGKTISNICKGGTDDYILNHRALLLFRQKHPKFDRFVIQLSTANAKDHHAEASARRAQVIQGSHHRRARRRYLHAHSIDGAGKSACSDPG